MSNDDSNNFIKNRPFPAYKGDGEYIFISYSHIDADAVFSELKKFRNEKYNIWYDQGIDVGTDWDDAIADALLDCSLFVCFISKNSLASPNVIKEIKFADDENKDIILIYLDDSQLERGLALRFRTKQAILKFAMNPEEYARQWKSAFSRYVHADTMEPPKSYGFKYLDELVHSGSKSISLEFDIKIEDFEKSEYADGINLDVDGLVIDGNKHSIDANDMASIFNVTGKNILIKNCSFKSGHSFRNEGSGKHESGGGAISMGAGASLSVLDCKFLNNYSEGDGGAIFNNGGILSVKNSNFENNSANSSGGAIASFKQLDIFKSVFRENKSYNGGAIYNYHQSTLTLRDSKLRNNSSEFFGGAIYNYGDLKAEDCSFSSNVSKGGGAVLNEGSVELFSTIFKNNSSSFGGAIFNMAKSLIKYPNDHSSNLISDGYVKCIDCNFGSNSANQLGGVICNLSKAKFDNCILGKNSASNFSHLINNGPKDVIKGMDNTVELSQFIAVMTLKGCDFKIKGNLEKNAIYNQKNCLLTITRDTIINQQSAQDNSNIFLNMGKIEFD